MSHNLSLFRITQKTMTGLLVASLAAAAAAYARAPASEKVYAIIDIHAVGPTVLENTKIAVKADWWIESDGELLVLADPGSLKALDRPVRTLAVKPAPEKLFLIRKAHQSITANLESDILISGGRSAVVQARTPYLESIRHPTIQDFVPNMVLARQAANETAATKSITFGDSTSNLVASIDKERWYREIEGLSAINRYSHGNGIAGARDYLVSQLSALPGLDVSTDTFRVGSTTSYNIIARMTGRTAPDEWIIVGAHYDSTSQSPSSAAPGAEDNGSGTAGLLELARILAGKPTDRTILFIAYSGEEQGLIGSRDHATKIVAQGHKDKVKAMLNMDMIGYSGDADLDCLIESDQRGANAIFGTMQAAATQYTRLRMVTSLNPFGSDHVPYINQGIPAVLTIENDWDAYPAYHRTGDQPANISKDMGYETLKMKAAVIAYLAGLQ